MATPAQIGKIRALLREGDVDFETALDLAEEIAGGSITKLEDLTTSDASALIDRLQDGRV